MDNTTARERIVDDSGYSTNRNLRPLGRKTTRTATIKSLLCGRRVVYAMRVPDGAIKIGTTVDLANRLSALHGELLGFRFAGHDEERRLHVELRAYRVRGREYFSPVADVMAVVNAMRDEFNLPHV